MIDDATICTSSVLVLASNTATLLVRVRVQPAPGPLRYGTRTRTAECRRCGSDGSVGLDSLEAAPAR
eukprot:scaffold485328_cov17-Prasinocladus_malaysianus.AAC.1